MKTRRGELPWAEVGGRAQAPWRKKTAPRLRARPGRNQTARTPRLRSGEPLSHQGAAGNGEPRMNSKYESQAWQPT